jgi:type IV secretion system protein VirB10
MKRKVALWAALAISSVAVFAQDQPQITPRVGPTAKEARSNQPTDDTTPSLPPAVVQAGTRIPLTLKQAISTHSARVGDPVYAQTAFPIVENNRIVIPEGTFVQGTIRSIVRPGKVKGRAQLQMTFTSMIFPNGYTVVLPGSVEGVPGSDNSAMKGNEGTIEQSGSKGKDAQTIATSTIPGAAIGALADGAKGAGIGAGVGGVVGLATVLLTRGPDVQLGSGSSIEMTVERTIEIDRSRTTARESAQ